VLIRWAQRIESGFFDTQNEPRMRRLTGQQRFPVRGASFNMGKTKLPIASLEIHGPKKVMKKNPPAKQRKPK